MLEHADGIGPGPAPLTARERRREWQLAVAGLRHRSAGTPLAASVELACGQGLVLRRSQARGCGLSEPMIRSLLARRCWSVPRRGVLCPLPPAPDDRPGSPDAAARRPHGLADQVRAAAVARQRPGTFVSHESAATMAGLPVLGSIRRPTLSIVDGDHLAARPDALIRCVGKRPGDVVSWFGAPVTTTARTVIDVARSSGVAAGLVAADAALHAGDVTAFELAEARAHARYRPGVRTADRVLEVADGRAESPLESLTRLCLIDGGLPAPRPQGWVRSDRGWYRVDLLYERERVIVECDGRLKYDGRDGAALLEEKLRQEALERADFVVVRVTWEQVRDAPWLVVTRVRRKLAAAA